MISSSFKASLLAAAMAVCASNASAALVTMNATADLSLATVSGGSIQAGAYFSNAAALPLVAPVTVATGDTFELKLDFLGNQQLTVQNMSVAWALVLTQNFAQASGIDMTGTLELLDSNGAVIASASKTDSNGSIHIGQVFTGTDFGSPASVTFAGLHYSGVVDSQSVNPRTYDSPSLWFQGSSVTISEFANNQLPEPASLCLGLLALGAAGVATRRRNAA